MLTIRPAQPADVSVMLRFVRELAEFERALDQVAATEAGLLRDGFGLEADGRTPLLPGAPVRFRALIAEWMEEAGDGPEPVGLALFYPSYSTWVGHHGIRLEDLYVTPARRGRGVGRALLAAVARVAVDEGCTRVEWDVLTWHEAAIAVYERIGATTREEWRIMRLSGAALEALATVS